jgi:hypothetical protein
MDAPLIRPARATFRNPGRSPRLRTLLLHNPRAGDGTPDADTLTVAIGIDGESFGVLCPDVSAPDAMAHERD